MWVISWWQVSYECSVFKAKMSQIPPDHVTVSGWALKDKLNCMLLQFVFQSLFFLLTGIFYGFHDVETWTYGTFIEMPKMLLLQPV